MQNWEQYLDFLISNECGLPAEFVRIVFERCLVPCFYYEHFWIKYANWSEEIEALPAVVELYQRGFLSLPKNCKTFRFKYLIFLKNSFGSNKDYVYTLFTQTVASYIKLWPNDAFLLGDYLSLLKRFHFPSNVDQQDDEIFNQQTLYSKFLETAVANYLEGKIDKKVPLQEMMNDKNLPIVVVELIRNAWLVLKNTVQTRKYFIAYGKNQLMKSSVTFWLTYYKFEKSLQNFTKLNKFINELGTVIFLPTTIISDIMNDYQNFFLLNSNAAQYQGFLLAVNLQKEMDPILYPGFKENDPGWTPGQFQNIPEWHKRREFRENGHPGIVEDRPRITNVVIQNNSSIYSRQAPPLPTFSNLEKINQPPKYNDYLSEQYFIISK